MGNTVKEKTSDLVNSARENVQKWSRGEQSAAERVSNDAIATTSSFLGEASHTFGEAKHFVENTATSAISRSGATVEAYSSQLQQTMNDQEARDQILVGAATVAVIAAFGIACQRRLSQPPGDRAHPVDRE